MVVALPVRLRARVYQTLLNKVLFVNCEPNLSIVIYRFLVCVEVSVLHLLCQACKIDFEVFYLLILSHVEKLWSRLGNVSC